MRTAFILKFLQGVMIAMSAVTATALELKYAGVAGNSGEAAAKLVISPIARSGGGVVLDADNRIFCSGGKHILVLNSNGQTLWTYPLPNKEWVLGGEGFAVSDGYLYFIAGDPLPLAAYNQGKRGDSREVKPNLCRVKMLPEQESQIVIPAEKLPWKSPGESGFLTLTSRDKELFLGMNMPGAGYTIYRVSSEGTLTALFSKKDFAYFSMDEHGDLYLGSGSQVIKVDSAGNPVADFQPAVPPKLGSTPSALRGQVLLTKAAIWDGGVYGYLARMDRQYRGYPGFVISRELVLDHFTQVADAPGKPDQYYIMSSDALYEAGMVEGKLQLLRRFGSLPEATGLVLTNQGYIGVGNRDMATLWFSFDNADPAATPLKTDWVPLGQGWYDGKNAMLFYRNWNKKVLLCRYRAEPFVDNESFEYPQTDGEIHPMASTRVGSHIFAIEKDGETRPLILSGETPLIDGKSRPQALLRAAANKMTGFATAGRVSDWLPGPADSLSNISDKALIMAGSGKIVALKPDAQGSLSRLWELAGPPKEPFGNVLHVGTSGNLLLVADSTRHRVLLYKFADDVSAVPNLEAQYGHTDKPDKQVDSLNYPTLLGVEGAKAVVFDSANQRVVKLKVE